MNHTVLVVDDSGYSRSMVKGLLEEAGYQVIGEARTGEEALDRILELKPDLVTLDNILPDMTGIEILQVLKEQGTLPHIIMISAVGQRSAIEEALELGAKSYLIKPFSKEDLLAEVKGILS